MSLNEYNFFKDKVIIITGSASGIGKAIALEFSKLNCNTVLVDKQVEKLSETCKLCKQCSPSAYTPLQVTADLTNANDVENVIGETIQTFGRIDVLVNSAGVEPSLAHKSELPSTMALFDHIIDVNLRACYRLSHLAFKQLSLTKGTIINISSALNTNTPLCVSKSGVDALTRGLALEWAKYGIRVNSVNPGHTSTPLLDESIPQLLLHKLYPIGRYGRPIDVANAVVFLASDKSNFITGVNLAIDGGYSNADALTGASIAKQLMLSDNFIRM